MNKIFFAFIIFGAGCSSNKSVDTLHNFPMIGDDCPSVEHRSIENKDILQAQAKALGMRYVDYLHFLSNNMDRDRTHIKIVRD
tara:strand:+ start:388 stop:636 length:249 start_codon:yes stop_codon:yes gene_type:complete